MDVAEELVSEQTVEGPLALKAEDVEVTYEVWEDHQTRSLKALVANGFRRPEPRRVHAVQGVSFDLHEGEALGLVGVNGSGKTTLLRSVAGLLPIQNGRIRARSEPVMLGVGAALHPHLSGRRNVYLGGTALGLTRDEVDRRFDDIVAFAGVGDFIDMPLRTFSAGMNARLRFSIAAAVEPDILLIDEALGVGDAQFKRKSETRMRELIAQAGALILVSHSLGSIEDLCTRVIWLDKGVVRLDGPTAEVLAAYRQNNSH
jgi:teichoic acid transport system ATP-binding protein